MRSLRLKPVVPPGIDAFWMPAGQALPEAPGPVRLVVLTQPYDSQSAAAQTLQNLLGACKLAPEAVVTLTVPAGTTMAWSRIREAWQPTVILLLGVTPAQLGIRAVFRPHAAAAFDGAFWVPTLALPELNERKEIRQALWTEALKPLFPGT